VVRVRGVKLFERDGTLRAGLLAGLLFAAKFSCIYLGLRDTTASRLTVFLYTSPFVVALLLPRWCRRRSCGRCNGSAW
jgi:drug/metabolite transporter (DMT)-like permease